MAELELRNESGLEFTDISSEVYRIYFFENGTVKVNRPQWLNVSKSGGHRVLDLDGQSHYIPLGWLHLMWQVGGDSPHFVK